MTAKEAGIQGRALGYMQGENNRLKQRLKDKCSNKSNASSEVVFYGLHAIMLGDEGRGIRTIVEMAHVNRLDFVIGSAGLMRQALNQVFHHTSNRRAFHRNLVDLLIMRNVVADLAVESEAMMWMSIRLAAALDRAEAHRAEGLLSRICTPVANTGPASAPRPSWRKRWNATAATASSPTT
jgi:putative acyl-CoA dehydrogenase